MYLQYEAKQTENVSGQTCRIGCKTICSQFYKE